MAVKLLATYGGRWWRGDVHWEVHDVEYMGQPWMGMKTVLYSAK